MSAAQSGLKAGAVASAITFYDYGFATKKPVDQVSSGRLWTIAEEFSTDLGQAGFVTSYVSQYVSLAQVDTIIVRLHGHEFHVSTSPYYSHRTSYVDELSRTNQAFAKAMGAMQEKTRALFPQACMNGRFPTVYGDLVVYTFAPMAAQSRAPASQTSPYGFAVAADLKPATSSRPPSPASDLIVALSQPLDPRPASFDVTLFGAPATRAGMLAPMYRPLGNVPAFQMDWALDIQNSLIFCNPRERLEEAEIAVIEANSGLSVYHHHLTLLLAGTWYACLGIRTGFLENGQRYASDHVADVINKAGQLFGFGLFSGIIAGLINLWNAQEKEVFVERVANIYSYPHRALAQLDALARHLTLAQTASLGDLTLFADAKGRLEKLAIADWKKILTAIKDGKIGEKPNEIALMRVVMGSHFQFAHLKFLPPVALMMPAAFSPGLPLDGALTAYTPPPANPNPVPAASAKVVVLPSAPLNGKKAPPAQAQMPSLAGQVETWWTHVKNKQKLPYLDMFIERIIQSNLRNKVRLAIADAEGLALDEFEKELLKLIIKLDTHPAAEKDTFLGMLRALRKKFEN